MNADNPEHAIYQQLQRTISAEAVDLSMLITQLQGELRQIARRQRRGGGAGDTLSTTALVNEAYLRFATNPELFEHIERRHFLAIAARSMQHIVINYARDRMTQKRGAGAGHISLDEIEVVDQDVAGLAHMLELNEALEQLARVRPRLAQVVQLRYFGGLSEDETGDVLGLDRSTVRRDWVKARGWLFSKLHPDAAE